MLIALSETQGWLYCHRSTQNGLNVRDVTVASMLPYCHQCYSLLTIERQSV